MTVEAPTTMLSPEARSFLAATPPRFATIATINRDGSPHQIVIWYWLRSDADGDRIVVNSRRGRRWPGNLVRDGRANVAVYDGEDAITMACVVEETYEGEAAQADIAALARANYAPSDADVAIARFQTEPRVSFVLKPMAVHIHGEPR